MLLRDSPSAMIPSAKTVGPKIPVPLVQPETCACGFTISPDFCSLLQKKVTCGNTITHRLSRLNFTRRVVIQLKKNTS